MDGKKLEILMVEDNPGDAFLISELLGELGNTIHLTLVKDGREALDIFTKAGRHKNVPSPDLVILDLNLPKVNGFDVLSYMKTKPELRSIPVVIMTGSLNKDDEERARCIGITDYCCKPSTINEMESTTICLKRHLDPLAPIDKNHCTKGPSALLRTHVSHSETVDRGFPSSRNGPFFDDIFDHDLRKVW